MEKALQFILSLSLLIVLHEMGHFIPARIFKTRVEKFYLFFDPWFSLFKKKIGDTVYGIGWLPLGGYVKISGMVDESMDTEAMKEEPKPWEFRAKPAWQRLIIITGGVIVNFILAFLIYAGIMAYYGEDYLPTENLHWGVMVDSTAQTLGFEHGDKIISIGGTLPERYNEIQQEMVLMGRGEVVVERDGRQKTIEINSADIGKMISSRSLMFTPRMPYIVGSFTKGSVAKEAGLEERDSIFALNGEQKLFFDQYLSEIPQYSGQEITLSVYRDGDVLDISMTVPEEGKIGVRPTGDISKYYELSSITYPGFSSIPAGFKMAKNKLGLYLRQFKLIADTETGAYKEVGGFYTIMSIFDDQWNWRHFWEITAFLSLMLGFLNILPIPALDGGHMIFILWEMATGRKPSTKFLEYAQMVGFFLLLALLLLANGNDILKLISK